MNWFHEIIREKGKIYPGNILKVDSFLNHQIDISVMTRMGQEIADRFATAGVTKVLTIESSGIAVAYPVAQALGCDLVFGKKHQTKNLQKEVYSVPVTSFTHGTVYDVRVSRNYITKEDVVLIVDDFLALGNAIRGLMTIIEEAGATLAGVGIAIEKGFQHGGDHLREEGVRIESMAIVESMDSETGEIVFREEVSTAAVS